nr:helix-turn-helix domain-containing protein [Clostridia bacterium]
MILADKILQLRRSNGWSQEELAERLNISRQSVSKWESAQSIPDIGKILELSQIFGVTTDYLLKDEIEKPAYSGTDSLSNLPGVSVQEANSYMEACARYARRVGMGVALCILSPALLILLIGFAMSNLPDMVVSERAATGAGTAILLAVARGTGSPEFLELAKRWTSHAPWEGFRLHDLILPLFFFIVGAAMPLSFGKRL